jgi:hypothetical protein
VFGDQGVGSIKGTLSLKDAVKEAKAVQGRAAKGADVVAEERKKRANATSTFKAIAERYMARDGKQLRIKDERERILAKYLYPAIGKPQIDDIRRVDVRKMLDNVEDEHGVNMAHNCLVLVRKGKRGRSYRGERSWPEEGHAAQEQRCERRPTGSCR